MIGRKVLGVAIVNKNIVTFQERSVGADAHVFAQQLHDNGCMTDTEWAIYSEWYDRLADVLNAKSQYMVYLQVSPETCLERIRMRGRKGEEAIDMEYLRQLHQKHEEWMLKNAKPVLILHEGGSLDDFTCSIRDFILEQQRGEESL